MPNKNKKIFEAAKYFIKTSEEQSDKKPELKIDALKLQKLLYYTQAWSLVINDKPAFPDKFEAWIHGPVNYETWAEFKTFNFDDKHPDLKVNESLFSEKDKKILSIVWDVYGKFDGKYLETLTHTEDPWLRARAGINETDRSNQIISEGLMKSYYEKRLQAK